tara:strand:- start:43 stop:243 length:201 start_codon:yes stop_codon:yes gene_type:complete
MSVFPKSRFALKVIKMEKIIVDLINIFLSSEIKIVDSNIKPISRAKAVLSPDRYITEKYKEKKIIE